MYENNLNKAELQVNRGFEPFIKKKEKKREKPKTFHLIFGKVISLFKREIHFHFEIGLDIRKS